MSILNQGKLSPGEMNYFTVFKDDAMVFAIAPTVQMKKSAQLLIVLSAKMTKWKF